MRRKLQLWNSCNMTVLDKAKNRLRAMPKDYTFSEARQLLSRLGFKEYQMRETYGFRRPVMNKPNDVLEYKGYHSRIVYDSVSKVLHGKVEGINDLITFESDSVSEIETEFRKAVDDYLAFCEDIGQEPDKEYKGTFNIRITPELHKKLVEISFLNNESLNNTVEKAIDFYVHSEKLKMSMIQTNLPAAKTQTMKA